MIAGISLIVLIMVILLAWKFKWNPGLLGFGAAFLLGLFVAGGEGESAVSSISGGCKVLFNGFNSKLWLRIMMVSIFFAVGQLDGTLEVMAKKAVGLIHGKNKFLPWIFYLMTLILSAIGSGSIGVLILLMPIAAQIVKEEKLDFMLTGLAVAIGAAVGGVSPMAATGIVGMSTASAVGIEVGTGIFTHYLVCGTITMVILYVLLCGWKYPNAVISKEVKAPQFTRKQLSTLTGIIIFAVMAIIGYEIAFAAGICVVGLCILHPEMDQKKIISMAPWPTLVLIGGMGVLISVVQTAGGITLITDFFSRFMAGKTVGVILTLIAGIMSFVSSASGVVMPSLIPTVPSLVASTGASALGLINAITFGAHQTGISPFSTGGSLILAMGGENIDQQKTFNKLIVTAFGMLLLACVYSFVGLLG